MSEDFYKPKRFPWDLLVILGAILLLGGIFKGQGGHDENPRVSGTLSQVKSYSAALVAFKDMYGALPGDMVNAGEKLAGCTGAKGSDCNPAAATAGDNIIGDPDFIKTLKPQVLGKTNVPAASAGDETILFWNHLLFANLIGGLTDAGAKNDSEISFGSTIPEAKSGGGFIVGYSNGEPWPKSLSPYSKGFEGTILVQISEAVLQGKAELNESDKQPLRPLKAAQIDRKLDDGRPGTGYVQGYGAPSCFSGKDEGLVYNETLESRDCGLIYRIGDGPKDVIPKKRSD